jgi:beta-alanine--pyruvate transaminase
MGAVFVSDCVHEAFMQGPEAAIDLFHGYTYSGHPLACAAALAALDTYEEEGLFQKANQLGRSGKSAALAARAAQRHRHPQLRPGRRGRAGAARGRAGRARLRGLQPLLPRTDLMVRVTGDVIAMSPPLILGTSHIEAIRARLGKAIQATA